MSDTMKFENLKPLLVDLRGESVLLDSDVAQIYGVETIDEYAGKRPERCLAVTSLSLHRYLAAVKYANAVIGNSLIGIVEVPSFKISTINIGDRQNGSVRVPSVVDCEPSAASISAAIHILIAGLI